MIPALKAQFREADHPRADDGKFGSGGGRAAPERSRPAGGGASGGPEGGGGGARSFPDRAQAHAWGREHYGEMERKLSGEQEWALEAYIGNGYKVINDFLRSERGGDLSAAPGKTAEVVGHLDGLLASQRTPEAVTAYRGVKGGVVRKLASLADSGGTFRDGGFLSATLSAATAADFADSQTGEAAAVVELSIPAGSRGAYVGHLDVANSNEAEFILPRGTAVKITGARRSESGVWFITAEVAGGDK